jgi:ADP-ribosylglycohydrolase
MENIHTGRIEDIRRRWELTTGTGVIVRPLEAAVQAVGNKGFDASAAEAMLPEGQRLFEAEAWDRLLVHMARIERALREAPLAPLPGIERPATLTDIRHALPATPALPDYDFSDYASRMSGGWLGKIIGGALGGPVEGWTRERIANKYGRVADYLAPPTSLNDDTAYPLVLLHTLEEYGPSFNSQQLALEWLEHLPVAYTAEAVALDNIRKGIFPPESATTDNPCSHWIGAMMKAEICGWLAPARPNAAIDVAYRDAIVAHDTEGVYGALFNAAMIAAAFVEPDPRRLVEIGLAYVPPRSQFADVARRTLAWCAESSDWQSAWRRAEEKIVGRYHWIHTFPNLAAVIVALWFGERDFSRSICIATMCGQDTDCTAGQVGAVIGTAQGAPAIPDRWRTPLGDRLESYVIGFEQVELDALVTRTCRTGERQRIASHNR